MTLVLTTSSTDGNLTLMDYWLRSGTGHYAQPDAFQLFVSRGWDLGRKGSGGGALGMLLAWPLWKTIGVIPGVALLVLLTIADGLALFRVDVKALIDRARSRSAQRREQADDAQRQRELAWQQAQAAQAAHSFFKGVLLVFIGHDTQKAVVRERGDRLGGNAGALCQQRLNTKKRAGHVVFF